MTARLRDALTAALGPLIWGSTYLVTTTLLLPNRPLLAGTLRALPVGLLIVILYRQFPTGIWWWRALVLGALNIGLFFALLFVAAGRLPGGVAAMVGASQPLLAGLLAWPMLGERPSRFAIVAACMGVLGVGLVVLGPSSRLDTLGVLAALAGTATMAVGTILVKKWHRPVGLLLFTAWQLTAGGLLLAVLTLLLEGVPVRMTLPNALGYSYLSLVGAGVAYTLWFRGVERLGAGASFLALLSPVSAVVLDMVVLHRTLTLVQVTGMLVVLISVVVGQIQPTRTLAQRQAQLGQGVVP